MGIYEIGALRTIINNLTSDESYYDVISGVSVGSINAAQLGKYDKSENNKMIDDAENFWFTLKNEDVWQFWPGHETNPAYGLFHEGGIVSTKPLIETLKNKVFNSTLKKDVIATAMDAQKGQPVVYHMNNVSQEMKPYAIAGSSAVPVLLPAVSMKQFGEDAVLLDGGSTWNVNMVSGIDKCLEKQGINSDKQVIVDVVNLWADVLGKMNVTYEEHHYLSLTPMAMRFLDRSRNIKSYYGPHDQYNVAKSMADRPDVQYRYYITPEHDLMPFYDLLNFDLKYTMPVYKQGLIDAQKAIDLGPGVSFQRAK